MAPTLRSDGQLRSPVTRPTSPQVMSPTRAGLLTNQATGEDNTAQDFSTYQDQAGFPLDRNATAASDASLSRSDAERLIRTLAGIQGGRSLAEALFEGLRDLHSAPHRENTEEFRSVPNQPPLPTSQGVDGRDPRQPHLDNMNPGGRYDDKELAEHTEALVSSPPIKLPKLHSKADYKAWHSEVPLHFDTRMLGDITYGTERYDNAEGLRRVNYHEWFEARKNKAFSALALSLSVDLRTTFKIDDISDNMDAAALLFERITQHFEAGDGINPDYLLQELVTRRLKSGETVTAYVDDVARKVTQLHQANGEIMEWQHARLLLSNCVEVYQGLAREHGDWINNHDRRSLTVAEAVQRLRAAEHQREQLRGQTGQPAMQTLRVAQVNAGQGQGQGQGTARKRSKQQRKRGKHVADKKQKTNCANCGGSDHWYSECTANTVIPLRPDLAEKDKARKQRQRKTPTSLVSSVCQTEASGVARSQSAGLSLCAKQVSSDTIELTSGVTSVLQDPPPSPTYSPTTPAESEDEGDHAGSLNVPSTPQQLQLQPAVPERQVQYAPPAMQPAVPGAVQSQWEGARSLGPAPSWESLLYYVGQGLMMNSQQRGAKSC